MRVIRQAASRHDRPRSLHEVAERTRAGQSFDPGLREFLDEFYSHPERGQDMISDEPSAIGVVQDALSGRGGGAPGRVLAAALSGLGPWRAALSATAFFAGSLEDLKATLLVESPVAFRRRMLSVGKDVLHRPRRFSAASSVATP